MRTVVALLVLFAIWLCLRADAASSSMSSAAPAAAPIRPAAPGPMPTVPPDAGERVAVGDPAAAPAGEEGFPESGRSVRIAGQIVDAETERPLASASLHVCELQPTGKASIRWPWDARSATADAEGRFDLRLPRVPRLGLVGMARGYLDSRVTETDGDRDHLGLRIALAPGAVVSALVLWRGGPITGYATLTPEHGDPSSAAPPATPIDVHGCLELPAVPIGRWLLQVEPTRGARTMQWIDLPRTGVFSIRVEVGDGTRLFGRAEGPLDDVDAIVCVHADGLTRRGVVAADGSFVVEGLFPGAWWASVGSRRDWRHVELEQNRRQRHPPDFVLGGEVERQFDVPAAAERYGRLRGHVATRHEVAFVHLLAADGAPSSGAPPQARVAADGAFVIDPVLPGRWTLRLQVPDAPTQTVDVVVRAGLETTANFR